MPTCNKCKNEIESLMYVKLLPALILQHYMHPIPQIFSCVELQEDYATEIILHDKCFIILLKELRIKVHDMKEVIKIYNEKAKEEKQGGK